MKLNRKEIIIRQLREELDQMPQEGKLDTIRRLMVRFDASQRTIEYVLGELAAEGRILRLPGRGWFTRARGADVESPHYRLFLPKWVSESHRKLEAACLAHPGCGRDFSLDTCSLSPNEEYFGKLPLEGCDGALIVAPAGNLGRRQIRALCSISIPFVLLSCEVGEIGFSMVCEHATSGGALAAAHLIRSGHRKLAMLITEPLGSGITMRCRGFQEFAVLSGAEVTVLDPGHRPGVMGDGLNYRTLSRHLETHGCDFTGLFVISAQAVIEVYKALNDHGYRVPCDVSVVVHDSIPSLYYLSPPVDHVHVETGDEVDNAFSVLKELRSGATCIHRHLSPRLEVLQSVKQRS